MSTQTTNLHLVKPADGEAADIGVINDNMDTIDSAVGALQQSVSFDSHVSSVQFIRETGSCGIRFTTDNGNYALDIFYGDTSGHMSFWKFNEQTQRWDRLWTI